MDYYERAGLTPYLDKLGFNLVGYGCTTCIGNSGPLQEPISKARERQRPRGRVGAVGQPQLRGPDQPGREDELPGVAAAGRRLRARRLDGHRHHHRAARAGHRRQPTSSCATSGRRSQEIQEVVDSAVASEMFSRDYADVFAGDERWQNLPTPTGDTFEWDAESTYVRKPPYFEGMPADPEPVTDIEGARVLAKLGDSVTTDHISPAGSIKADSPAGAYLQEHGVDRRDFNSYGSRRGNHEVMIRGTFANIRLRNQLAPGTEGGFTRDFTAGRRGHEPSTTPRSATPAAGTPLVILAGKEYGSGSSRDWAAKGTALLGVRAVIAESYERIHRSNLIGMGVLPLQYRDGETRRVARADRRGEVRGHRRDGAQRRRLAARGDGVGDASGGESVDFQARLRIDTPGEADYYRHGGILQYVLRSLLRS